MNLAEFMDYLQGRNAEWEALLEQAGPERMEQPGVNGDWSMKDVVAHLTGWHHWMVARLRAAVRGEAPPPAPWPAHLEEEDDINAWIYAAYRDKPAEAVLAEMRALLQEQDDLLRSLPAGTRIETVETIFHLVWVGDRRFHVTEFLDHFRDDHEADVRAWMEGDSKAQR